MINKFKKLSKADNQLVQSVSALADKSNVKVYLVGGVVRDLILNRPICDIDFLIIGDAIKFATHLSRQVAGELVTYPRFKTATITLKSGQHIDFVSARSEVYEHPGALPKVKFGTIQDDLARRDFAINAIAQSVNSEDFGQYVDLFQGIKDIDCKEVRILHEKSFKDDPTRILRAIRFEQRLGYRLEKHTQELLIEVLNSNVIDRVKPARYLEEFKKVFQEDKCVAILERLHQLGGQKLIDIDIQFNKKHMKIITEAVLSNNERITNVWGVCLMGYLSNSSLKTVKRILDRFPVDKEVRLGLKDLGDCAEVLRNLRRKSLNASEVYQLLIMKSDLFVQYLLVSNKDKVVQTRIIKFLDSNVKGKTAISGDDLKRMGVVPGKAMKQILNQVLYQRLDGKLKSKKDEIAFVKSLL